MAERYLERWSGWLLPPVTGRYRFILSAQDAAELWLGSSNESGSATRLIRLDQPTPATSWRNPAREQVSTTIRLEKGKAYWIEARHVRGGRSFLSGAQGLRVEPDDHLIVAWVGEISVTSTNLLGMGSQLCIKIHLFTEGKPWLLSYSLINHTWAW